MALPLPFQFGPDFTNFLLPWIFTFAIVYGLLMKIDIFGTNVNQKVSVALAFVIAFFVSATGGPQLGAFFTSLFGGASTFLAGILVVILFVTMVGFKFNENKQNTMALGLVVIIGVVLFLAAQGNISGFRLDQNTSSLIFWAVVVLAVIYYVAHGGETKATPAPMA